jgi:hypothetical protein
VLTALVRHGRSLSQIDFQHRRLALPTFAEGSAIETGSRDGPSGPIALQKRPVVDPL